MGQAPSPAETKQRLNSWKEIAAYLGRDERTAQRWERECGLPIYRTPGKQRGSVFAYPHELDAWLKGQPEIQSIRGLDKPKYSLRHVSIIAGVAISSAAITTLILVLLYLRPGPALKVTVEGRTVIGWSAGNHKAWTYTLPDAFELPAKVLPFQIEGRSFFLVDVVRFNSSSISGEIDCFSSRGNLVWSYRPHMTLQFGSQVDDGPWAVMNVAIGTTTKGIRVFAAVDDFNWGHGSVWELDPQTGKATNRFVNSGELADVAFVRAEGRNYILASGYNNEYDTASVAVMDETQPYGVSPQTPGTRYFCTNCGQGSPSKYILLPHSELNRLLLNKAANIAVDLEVYSDRVEAHTDELSAGIGSIWTFALEPKIVPKTLFYSAQYWVVHRNLERELRMTHHAQQCPEYVYGKQIRAWTPGGGWTEVHVPYLYGGPLPQS